MTKPTVTQRKATPHVPKATPTPGSWILETGGGGGGTGPGGGAPPAPNVLDTTTAGFIPHLLGNSSVFDLAGVIHMPTADPNYAHLASINVLAFGPGQPKQGTSIGIFHAPFTDPQNYQGGNFPQTTASQTWKVEFVCSNEDGAPTLPPFSLNVVVGALNITSMTAREVPNERYLDGSQLPHTMLGVTPVITGNQIPENVTILRSMDGGQNFVWINWYLLDSVGKEIQVDTLVPGAAAQVEFAGIIGPQNRIGDAGVPVPRSQLPPETVFSAPFTLAPIQPPSPNGVTNAVAANPVPLVDVLGNHNWGIPAVSWSDPLIDAANVGAANYDPNAWYTVLTYQTCDSAGNPAPNAQGGQEVEVQEFAVIKGGVHTCTMIQDYGFNPAGSPYHFAKLRIYTTNRLVQHGFHDMTNAVVQNCWSGANFILLDFGQATLVPNFTIDFVGSGWPGDNQLELDVHVEIASGDDPNNLIRGGHLYLEIPDISSNPDFTVGTSPIGGSGTITGNWNPLDLGRFPYDPAQQPWQAHIDNTMANIMAEETLRLYVCSYSDTVDNTLVRATNPTDPSPSIIVTVDPPFADKPGAATNVTDLPGAITAITLPDDNSTGKLLTPVQVFIASVPNTQWWVMRLILTWNGDDPNDPNSQSVATTSWSAGDYANFPMVNGLPMMPAGPDKIAAPHSLAIQTPQFKTTVTVWGQAGLIDPSGTTTAVRWNNIVPGITPNSGPLPIGVDTGTIDLGASMTDSVGPALKVKTSQTTGFKQLTPVFVAPIALTPKDELAITFAAPIILDPSNALNLSAAAPLYTTVTGQLAMNIGTDFAVDDKTGQLTVGAVDLAKAYGFDPTNFQVLPGPTGKFTMKALAVNQLIAGNALFLGDTIFAVQGGGQMVLTGNPAPGIALADNQANPLNTVTITPAAIQLAGPAPAGAPKGATSSLVTIQSSYIQLECGSAITYVGAGVAQFQNGTNLVQVQSAGVLIETSTTQYMSLTSSGIAILADGGELDVSSTGIQMKDNTGAKCTIQSGLINLVTGGQSIQLQSTGIYLADAPHSNAMSLTSTGVTISNNANSVAISSTGVQITDSTGTQATIMAGVITLTHTTKTGTNSLQINDTGVTVTGQDGAYVQMGGGGVSVQSGGTSYVSVVPSGVTIHQGQLTNALNGTTTTLGNVYDGNAVMYMGLQVTLDASTAYASVGPAQFYGFAPKSGASISMAIVNAGVTTAYGKINLQAGSGIPGSPNCHLSSNETGNLPGLVMVGTWKNQPTTAYFRPDALYVPGTIEADSGYYAGNTLVINSSGQWVGPAIGGGGSSFASLSVSPGGVYSTTGYTGGSFQGAGVAVGDNGISCTYLSVTASHVGDGSVHCVQIYAAGITVGGVGCVNASGEWINDVQTTNVCYAGEFGIYGKNRGWPAVKTPAPDPAIGTFRTGDGRTVTVQGGLIIGVA
jgi:hypothetical protein